MSHTDDGPLASYNSLLDPHLSGYFSNTRIRRHLRKSGLVTKRGSVVTETQYRLNAARKEHRKQVRELLATAIVNRTLDIERHRQSVIKRKLEEIAKVELVKRVKAEREKQKDASLLPLLSPKTGRQWSYFAATDAAAETAADASLVAGGPRPPRERRGSAPTLAASSAAAAAVHRQRLYEPRPHTAGHFDDGHSPLFVAASGEPAAANVSAGDTARPLSAESQRSLKKLDLDPDRRAAFFDADAAAGSEDGNADNGGLAPASPRQSDDGSGVRSVTARGRRQVTSVDTDGYPVLRRRDEASATAPANGTPRPPAATAAAVFGASSSSEPSPPPPPPSLPPRIESSLSSETQRDGRTISPRRPRRRHFGGSAAVEGGDGGGTSHHVHPLLTVSSEPIDTRHLWALDRTSLEKYNELLEREQLGRLQSPYRENLAAAAGVAEPPLPPAPLQQPHPPAGPRRVPALQRRVVLPRDKGNSRAEGAAAERSGTAGLLMLHRLGPAFKEQELVQSFCEVTLRFFGAHPHPDRRRSPAAATAAASALDLRQEVLVEQQHCGGSTLVVFRALLLPKKDFVIISRRHRGYPFSLTFFVDGLLDARVSACCEYKHQSGYRLGGKSGHFGIVSVKGSAPCYKCQVERGLHISSAPPQPKWRFGSKASKGQQKSANAAASAAAEQSAAHADVSHEQSPRVADSGMTNYRDDFEADKDAAAEPAALGASGDSPAAEPQAGDDAQPSGYENGIGADQTADRLVKADDSASVAPPEDGARAMQVDGAQSRAYSRSADSDMEQNGVRRTPLSADSMEQNPAGGAADETAATPVAAATPAPLTYEDDFEEEPFDQVSEHPAETTARVPESDVEETEHAVRSPRLPADRGPTTENELTALTAAMATSAPPRSRSSSLSSSASSSSSLSTSASSAFMSSTDSLDSLVTSSLLGLASLTSEQQSPPDVPRVDGGSARPSSAEPTTTTPQQPPVPDTSEAAAAAAAVDPDVAVVLSNVSDKLPSSAGSSQSSDADRVVRPDDPEPEVFITQMQDAAPVVDGLAVQQDPSNQRDSSPPAAGLQGDVGSDPERSAAHESERRSASPVRRHSADEDGDRAPGEQNETEAIEVKDEAQAEGDDNAQADGENDYSSGGEHSEARLSANGEHHFTPKTSAPDMQQQAEEQASSETSQAKAVGDASQSEAKDAPSSDCTSPFSKPEDIADPETIGDSGEQFNQGEGRGGAEGLTDYPPKDDKASAAEREASKSEEEQSVRGAAAPSLSLVDPSDDNNYEGGAKVQSPHRKLPVDHSVDVERASIDGASPEAPASAAPASEAPASEAPASEPSDYLPLSKSGSRNLSPRTAADSQGRSTSRSNREPPAGRESPGDRAASPGGSSTSVTSENENADAEASGVDMNAVDSEGGTTFAATAALAPPLDASSAEVELTPEAEPPPQAERQERASSADTLVADGDAPAQPPPQQADAQAVLPITISLATDESHRPVDGTENINEATLGLESSFVPETKSSADPPSPSSLAVPSSPFVDSRASFPYVTAGLARPSTVEADVERQEADRHLTFEIESAATAAAAPPAAQHESPTEEEVKSRAVEAPVRQDDNPLGSRHDGRHDDQRELHPSLPETAPHPGELVTEAEQTSSWAGEERAAADAHELQRTVAADLNEAKRPQSSIELPRPPPSESPAEDASVSSDAASSAHAGAEDPIAVSRDSDGRTAAGKEAQSDAEVTVAVREPPASAFAAASVESINPVLPSQSADRVVADVDRHLELQPTDERNDRESALTAALAGDATKTPGNEGVALQPGDSGGASRLSNSVATVTTESTAAVGTSISHSVPLDAHLIADASRGDGGHDGSGRETSTRDATDAEAHDVHRDATDNDGDQSSLDGSLATEYEFDARQSEPLPSPPETLLEDQPETRIIEHSSRESHKADAGAQAAGASDDAPEQQQLPPQSQQQKRQHLISDDHIAERRPQSDGASSSSPPVDDYSVTETHFESYHSSPGGGDERRRDTDDGGDAALAAEPASAADGVGDPEPAVGAESVAAVTEVAVAPECDDAVDGGGGKGEMGAISLDGAIGSGNDGMRRAPKVPEDGSEGGGDGGGGLAKEERHTTARTDVEIADEVKSIVTSSGPLGADFRPEAVGSGSEDS